MNRFSVRSFVLLLALLVASGVVEGQNITTTYQPTNETTSGPSASTTFSPALPSTVSSSPSIATTTEPSGSTPTTEQLSEDPGPALYKLCALRNGTVCYGDKPNCIKNGNCTFLGAIRENETIIDIKVLTRVYDPPYDGVNLTVELLRDKKGNESVLRCTRPRFKSFKIRLSWKNKTSFEVPDQPGNETQLAETVINKEQLQNECMEEQENNNATIPPSQTLALKFYITNNNTLVSQGLTHVDVQEPGQSSTAATPNGSDREARNMKDPLPTPPSKEDALYEMCLKNRAKCFGDRMGCTEGHNCTILGVIQESQSNYHVYLVTKSYDPPVSSINLTLTLNTTISNSSSTPGDLGSHSTGITASSDVSSEECRRPDFKDLSIQSIWKAKESPQVTNDSQILEAMVDKATIQSRCQIDVRAQKVNSSAFEDIVGETLNFYLRFHLENGTLVPLEISNDSSDDSTSQNSLFQIGQNGTAYLVSENNGAVSITSNDDVTGQSTGNSAGRGDSNGSRALTSYYATYLTLIIPFLLAYYHPSYSSLHV